MTSDTTVLVTEVFSAIQGEGALVGERQVFLRLTGCNIRCAYCDQPEALEKRPGPCRLEQTPGRRDWRWRWCSDWRGHQQEQGEGRDHRWRSRSDSRRHHREQRRQDQEVLDAGFVAGAPRTHRVRGAFFFTDHALGGPTSYPLSVIRVVALAPGSLVL